MMTAIDLCCGEGGWTDGLLAEGYRVFGFDVARSAKYRGQLVLQDVRTIDGRGFRGVNLIVASPPCEEFSRHQMPWTKRRNPPEPDLSIVEACWRIAIEAEAPIVLENVRNAQRWLGRAKCHVGPFYLWGAVPPLMPDVRLHRKERMSSSARLARARIPFDLARWIAQVLLTDNNS